MLRQIILLLAVALVQHSAAEQEIPGKPVISRRSLAPFAATFPLTCNPTGHYVQCNSCSSYRVCLAGVGFVKYCPAAKPFCNNNECSASPDYSACPVSSLNCTGTGFYPDPKTCQFYHYCQHSGEQSDVYECPRNYAYNPETTMCRQNIDVRCDSIQCDPYEILQRYGNSNKYFAYCRNQEILMAKCDDLHEFTGTSCVFRCPKEGRFAHSDPSKYYECYYLDEMLVAQELKCALDKVYNAIRGICLVQI